MIMTCTYLCMSRSRHVNTYLTHRRYQLAKENIVDHVLEVHVDIKPPPVVFDVRNLYLPSRAMLRTSRSPSRATLGPIQTCSSPIQSWFRNLLQGSQNSSYRVPRERCLIVGSFLTAEVTVSVNSLSQSVIVISLGHLDLSNDLHRPSVTGITPQNVSQDPFQGV